MTAETTGTCACGAIRYAATGEPVFRVNCHCNDCRRESGTGHASYIGFTHQNVRIEGKTGVFSAPADSGQPKHRHFCPACGTILAIVSDSAADFIAIRAGTLTDDAGFRPDFVVYAARAIPADPVFSGVPVFAMAPAG